MDNNVQYNIFGSVSSYDYDLVVKVDAIGNISDSHDVCKDYNNYFEKILKDKKINCNLVVIKDNLVVDCFKGTIDELNNAIFLTYDFHQQQYDCFVNREIPRDVELKIARCFRSLISMYSRTDLRSEIKIALRGNIQQQLTVLEKIDFTKLIPEGKKESLEDIYKVLAFQIGQTFGLIDGKELYTKEDISLSYPFLHSFIYRQKSLDLDILNKCAKKLINIVNTNYQNILDKNENTLKNKKI